MSFTILIGAVIFGVGVIIFAFGKKFFILRAFFGDRSMLSQIFWGGLLSLIGFIILYLGGAFK